MDLMDKLTTLLTAVVELADKAQHDAEVARVREEMAQAKENLAAEEVRMAAKRAALTLVLSSFKRRLSGSR